MNRRIEQNGNEMRIIVQPRTPSAKRAASLSACLCRPTQEQSAISLHDQR
jgi:hypothetical protein